MVCLIGVVGCGKTSLLSSILGEMIRIQGSMTRDKIGYVSQKAWIQNCSLRDAILFGQPFDKDRYEQTIEVAQLSTDLLVLPNGDLTEIGERGINLSGGQKQRVAIARLIYSAKDIDLCIFDDPLSALDVHVASALFKEAICGSFLKEKTRIISLNSHYHLLQDADYILVMEDGSIASQGNYDEVSKTPLFKHLMSSMEQDQQNDIHMEANGDQSSDMSRVAIPRKSDDVAVTETNGDSDRAASPVSNVNQDNKTVVKLVKAEDREIGAVGLKTLIAYYDAASNGKNGILFCSLVLSMFVVAQGIRTVDDIFLSLWSRDSMNLTYLPSMLCLPLTFIFSH